MRVKPILGVVAAGLLGTLLSMRRGAAAPPLPQVHAAFIEADGTSGPSTSAAAGSAVRASVRSAKRTFTASGCSSDMVRVAGRFCIDRYEGSMLDDVAERPISPYYPPLPALLRPVFEEWTQRLAQGSAGVDVALPFLADWQRSESYRPRAVSRAGVVPQGYVNKPIAENACASAGKRLCTLGEWTTACRGQKGTKFPYGSVYQQSACNVFRYDHPGMILHGSFSVDLLDPRLNAVVARGETLLRPTGATPGCKSEWEDDGVYDMVGNLDEWVDDPEGTFVGGFYARSTRNGCDSKISAHGPAYLDYSTGFRCCDSVRY